MVPAPRARHSEKRFPGPAPPPADALPGLHFPKLRDPTSIREVEARLFREGYSGVVGHLLSAVVGMGGPEAPRILETYADDGRAEHPATAIQLLYKLDVLRARTAASRLLADPRAEALRKDERDVLRRMAGG